jgi:hypothetical protein
MAALDAAINGKLVSATLRLNINNQNLIAPRYTKMSKQSYEYVRNMCKFKSERRCTDKKEQQKKVKVLMKMHNYNTNIHISPALWFQRNDYEQDWHKKVIHQIRQTEKDKRIRDNKKIDAKIASIEATRRENKQKAKRDAKRRESKQKATRDAKRRNNTNNDGKKDAQRRNNNQNDAKTVAPRKNDMHLILRNRSVKKKRTILTDNGYYNKDFTSSTKKKPPQSRKNKVTKTGTHPSPSPFTSKNNKTHPSPSPSTSTSTQKKLNNNKNTIIHQERRK